MQIPTNHTLKVWPDSSGRDSGYFLLLCVIKHHDHRRLVKKELILTYSSIEKVHNVRGGMTAGVQNRKLRDHMSTHPQWQTSLSKAPPPKASITSPKMTVKCLDTWVYGDHVSFTQPHLGNCILAISLTWCWGPNPQKRGGPWHILLNIISQQVFSQCWQDIGFLTSPWVCEEGWFSPPSKNPMRLQTGLLNPSPHVHSAFKSKFVLLSSASILL